MNPTLNSYDALVGYLRQNWRNHKAIIIEGIRGCGKTTLIEKLAKSLAADGEDEPVDLPIYQTFGSRKGLALSDAQVDLPTTSFMVLDVVRQIGLLCPVLIDRNYISTMVFNGWTHGRLTMARRLWKALNAVHIVVNVCHAQLQKIVDRRQDLTIHDLSREEELFQAACHRSLDELSVVNYWNRELCGHDGDPRTVHCAAAANGFDNEKYLVKQT